MNQGIHVFGDRDVALQFTANETATTLNTDSYSVLGTATGRTFDLFYPILVRLGLAGAFPASRMLPFGLDEYRGVPPEHPASYFTYMRTKLWEPLGLPQGCWGLPQPYGLSAAEIVDMCARYDDAITALGEISVQLLGIGPGGHIGFNEPGSRFDSPTRLVELSAATIATNSFAFVDDPVPELYRPPSAEPPVEELTGQPWQAVTFGISGILRARRIVVVAFGTPKSGDVRDALEGPVDEVCPASVLQTHPNVLWVLDDGAASKLERSKLVRH